MSPRWRKVLRDLWINKTRTFLVVLSIAVGIFAIGVIAGTQAVLTREVNRVYTASHASSASLYSTFDDDFVKSIQHMAGVADAEGRSEVVVRARAGDGLSSMVLVAVHDFNDVRIDKFQPAGGAWPPAKRELLIERSAAGPLRASIGSTITVDLPNGTERVLRVAGMAYDFQSPPPVLGGMSYGYITLDALEWLGFPRTYNQLDIVVAQNPLDRQHIVDVANSVKDRVEKEQGHTVSSIRIPDPGKPLLDNAVQAVLLILGALGALSVLASGFLIVNVIAALLAQQIRQIGVMKAVGARNDQIVVMYLGMVLILGVLALCFALPAGVLGAQALTRFGAGLLNVELADVGMPPSVMGLQVVVGLTVPVLASLSPVISGTQITVHQAFNTAGAGSHFGEHFVDRLIAGIRVLSRPLMLSLRNTIRRKGRLAFTLTTLTIGGAIFVGVFGLRASLLRALSDSLGYWGYNVVAYTIRFYPVEQLQHQALSVPGVLQAEAWGRDTAVRVFPDGSESRSFDIIAPPADTTLLRPILVAGRWLTADDTGALVINSDVQADHPDLGIGSSMVIKMNGHKSEWKVVGIVRGVLSGSIAYLSYPEYARAAREFGRASSVVVVTDRGDANTERLIARDLEDHFKRAGMQTSATSTTTSERATEEYQFGLLITFLALMAVLLAIVGGLGLMGTMSINVLERIREIGVMRAVGASDGAVMRIIVVEGVLIGLFSWLFAVVMSWPIAHFLGTAIGTTLLHERLADTFSPLGVGLWLLIVVAVSALASFIPAARAARLSVREVLSYE